MIDQETTNVVKVIAETHTRLTNLETAYNKGFITPANLKQETSTILVEQYLKLRGK
jgi:hypothetical protein